MTVFTLKRVRSKVKYVGKLLQLDGLQSLAFSATGTKTGQTHRVDVSTTCFHSIRLEANKQELLTLRVAGGGKEAIGAGRIHNIK